MIESYWDRRIIDSLKNQNGENDFINSLNIYYYNFNYSYDTAINYATNIDILDSSCYSQSALLLVEIEQLAENEYLDTAQLSRIKNLSLEDKLVSAFSDNKIYSRYLKIEEENYFSVISYIIMLSLLEEDKKIIEYGLAKLQDYPFPDLYFEIVTSAINTKDYLIANRYYQRCKSNYTNFDIEYYTREFLTLNNLEVPFLLWNYRIPKL